MKILLILLAILCTVAAAPDPASTSYQHGSDDRDAWETWFNGLTDPEKEGAEYWAAQRRLKAPVQCVAHRMDEPWLSACKEAKSRLTPIDKMRTSDPQYWNGWNKKIIPLVKTTRAAENQKSTPVPASSNDQNGSFGIGWMIIIGIIFICLCVWARSVHTERKKTAALKAELDRLLAKYDNNMADVRRIMAKEIWTGMTRAQLIDSQGVPVDVDDEVNSTGHIEIFKYRPDGVDRFRLRIKILNNRVTGWQTRGVVEWKS